MRELPRRLALIAVSTGLTLLAAEIGLRACAPIPYSTELLWEADGRLGARLVPRRTYRLADGGSVRVGRLGYRSRERLTWDKPEGTFRLAVLGGSSAFCYLTDDAGIWTSLLEDRLRARFGPDLQVVNAAMPGLDVADSVVHYLYRVRELEPDAVLVYHGWNDMKRFRDLEEGEHLVREGVYREDRLRRVLRRLQLAWRVRSLLGRGAPGAPPPRPELAVRGEVDADARIPDDGRAHAWERRNVEDLARSVAADGALLVLVAQASLVDDATIRDPATRERIYTEYQRLSYDEVLRQTRAIHAILRETAAASDAVFIDAWSAVPRDLEHFHDHVHLTPAGNARVAAAVYAGLVADPRFDARVRAAHSREDDAHAP